MLQVTSYWLCDLRAMCYLSAACQGCTDQSLCKMVHHMHMSKAALLAGAGMTFVCIAAGFAVLHKFFESQPAIVMQILMSPSRACLLPCQDSSQCAATVLY